MSETEYQQLDILNKHLLEANKDLSKKIERLNDYISFYEDLSKKQNKEIERLNNIINEFEDFITNVDSHINLGDESEEFILVRDKWLELQELKGVDKE